MYTLENSNTSPLRIMRTLMTQIIPIFGNLSHLVKTIPGTNDENHPMSVEARRRASWCRRSLLPSSTPPVLPVGSWMQEAALGANLCLHKLQLHWSVPHSLRCSSCILRGSSRGKLSCPLSKSRRESTNLLFPSLHNSCITHAFIIFFYFEASCVLFNDVAFSPPKSILFISTVCKGILHFSSIAIYFSFSLASWGNLFPDCF